MLEIGPGPATLTKGLAEFAHVVAVDVDPRVEPIVAEVAPNARFVCADVLSVDLESLVREMPAPCGVVSNMPYNITGPLLERVAGLAGQIDRAVLMMQAEVARKVLAGPGSSQRGALSVCMQWDFEIGVVAQVPPGAFYPPPKVLSTVLRLAPRTARPNEAARAIVRKGFSHPRKTLVGNLGWPREPLVALLAELGHAPTVRAHQLSGEDWLCLAAHLAKD